MKYTIKKGFYPWANHLVRWIISQLPKKRYYSNSSGITLTRNVEIKIKTKKG